MRPGAVSTPCRAADAPLPCIAHPSRGAGVKLCASLTLARAVLAAHLNRLTADLHFDGVCIQLAVASRTGLLCHDTALRMNPRIPGAMSRPRCAGERCQNL